MTAHNFPHSSSLQSCSHDEAKKEMTIIFANGKKWIFSPCDKEHFEALKAAESPGAHFHQHIRRKFDSRNED